MQATYRDIAIPALRAAIPIRAARSRGNRAPAPDPLRAEDRAMSTEQPRPRRRRRKSYTAGLPIRGTPGGDCGDPRQRLQRQPPPCGRGERERPACLLWR